MTAYAFTGAAEKKFIPVLRRGSWIEAAPDWLLGRAHIDLCDDPYSESEYEELLRTLHGARDAAPPIGDRPDFGDGRGSLARTSPGSVTPSAGPPSNKPRVEIPSAEAAHRIPRPRTAAPWSLYAVVLTLALLGGATAVYVAWRRGNAAASPSQTNGKPSPPTQVVVARLEGYVTDKQTRAPVADVKLSIQDWDNRDGGTPTATTDEAGRFRFGNLRPSDNPSQLVRLIATKPGYATSTTDALLNATDYPITLKPLHPSGG
jgi:hypothetical protein